MQRTPATAAAETLTWGFRVAATLMLAGVVISLIRQQPLETELPSISTIIDQVLHLEGDGWIGLAIISIVLTPVVTVLTISITCFRQNDRRFGTISLAVLGILALSIAWSQR